MPSASVVLLAERRANLAFHLVVSLAGEPRLQRRHRHLRRDPAQRPRRVLAQERILIVARPREEVRVLLVADISEHHGRISLEPLEIPLSTGGRTLSKESN